MPILAMEGFDFIPPKFAYDQPRKQKHVVQYFAPHPNKFRVIGIDTRVIIAKCGLKIALLGHPKDRPAKLTKCKECYG